MNTDASSRLYDLCAGAQHHQLAPPNMEDIKQLLEDGANPNYRRFVDESDDGHLDNESMLMLLGDGAHRDAMELLLDHGADIDYRGYTDVFDNGLSALSVVVESLEHCEPNEEEVSDRIACARLLLERGARTDADVAYKFMTIRQFGDFIAKANRPQLAGLLQEFQEV